MILIYIDSKSWIDMNSWMGIDSEYMRMAESLAALFAWLDVPQKVWSWGKKTKSHVVIA